MGVMKFDVSDTPRLKGALGTKDARGDFGRLEVVSTPSRAFRHCLKETDVINVNEIHNPLLYEFQEDGKVVANGQIVHSDASMCHLKFPELPKKPGQYVFVLSCRDGRGTDFEPKRVTRRVTVR